MAGTHIIRTTGFGDVTSAAHPLRILLDAPKHTDMIRSFLRMAETDGRHCLPNFP